MTLNFGAAGVANYDSYFGSPGSFPNTLGSWTDVSTLEDLYSSFHGSFSPGPLLDRIKGTGDADKDAMLSLLSDALEQRKSTALTFYSGKMNKQRVVTWMLVRHVRGLLQELVMGVPAQAGGTPTQKAAEVTSKSAAFVQMAGPWVDAKAASTGWFGGGHGGRGGGQEVGLREGAGGEGRQG